MAPQVLGVLACRYGDFDAAEDAVQEALLAAARHWARDGIPDRPRGWLLQTASRKLIDQARSEQQRRRRENLAAALNRPLELQRHAAEEAPARDDTLSLLLMCCHPALTPASAIALTLRAVGGLTTAEIALAFMVPEASMAQRISRAKQSIKTSAVPLRMPGPQELPGRLRVVMHVLYLIFNEGYASSSGPDLQRAELSGEAIRLTRKVHRLLPDDPEVAGLLALMLLVDARRPARTGPDGGIIPLPEQDRALWDRELVAQGVALVEDALGRGPAGEYLLQAAIAAVHDRAERAADTDWAQILALYEMLERLTGNPVVTLNRAVAAAMVHGPQTGLAVLAEAGDRLGGGGHRLESVRAHLLEMTGEAEAAAAHYAAAAARATNLQEQHYLARRAARLRRTQKEIDFSDSSRRDR